MSRSRIDLFLVGILTEKFVWT